jgi:hypothetical protein
MLWLSYGNTYSSCDSVPFNTLYSRSPGDDYEKDLVAEDQEVKLKHEHKNNGRHRGQ